MKRLYYLISLISIGDSFRQSIVLERRKYKKHQARIKIMQRTMTTKETTAKEEKVLSQGRALDREFITIAIPALIQFSAEPIVRVVDTIWLARLGAAALGGAGAALAATYAISKLYNDPLLRSSISLVAADSDGSGNAATAALSLALLVGFLQSTVSFLLAPVILSRISLVRPGSIMREPALAFFRVSALGAPISSLWLAVNGIFRGYGDTFTPLKAALLFTGLNAILCPFFIFKLNFGAGGAALATVSAQSIALYPLLRALAKRQNLNMQQLFQRSLTWTPELASSIKSFASAGAFIFIRTLGKICAYAVCAREAARLGAVASAAHSLCFQLGVATTQLCEAAAVATQSLLARVQGSSAPSSFRRSVALQLLVRGLGTGLIASTSLAIFTYFNQQNVLNTMCGSEPAIYAAAQSILPLVLFCQILKGCAYPVNGALMGFLDWKISSIVMWLAQAVCALTLIISANLSGGTTLYTLWSGLVALFSVQCLAGLARVISGTGPWKLLYTSSS
uniref:Protein DETOXIFICATION n=1 Tax=Aureoumbra lagunensis TaxID=44058 RepID=A0A6S8EW80_9STRA